MPAVLSDTAKTGQKSAIGSLSVANSVGLAPMPGVTDAPFRGPVAAQRAALVISEVTADAALAKARRSARLRVEDRAAGLHGVGLAAITPSAAIEPAIVLRRPGEAFGAFGTPSAARRNAA